MVPEYLGGHLGRTYSRELGGYPHILPSDARECISSKGGGRALGPTNPGWVPVAPKVATTHYQLVSDATVPGYPWPPQRLGGGARYSYEEGYVEPPPWPPL